VTLSTVRCRILGQAEIHTKGIRLTPESDLQFGLALYFCANAGRDMPRDELARLFWPNHTLEAARHCLRQAIYRLRVLGVGVRSGPRTTVLDAHLVEADFAMVTADGAPSASFLRLNDVTILPGYSTRFSRPYSRWIEDFRGELAGRLRRGLVRAISEMRARGRYADVERLCRFCLQLDPLNEEATLALAEAVALAGGKVEAVGMIDRYEGEIGGYRPELRVPASLLRERISDRLIRRSQAPVELPMVGREQDVERVLSAFQRLRGNRAVSYVITGVAGVGKTRLAYECCRMAELQGARLLTISTQPSSRTQALFAVSELVDGLLQMPGAIGCAPAALECLKAMSSPVPIREPSLSLDADSEARFAVVRWSILDVLDAILSEGPLVIHVDDAHQLDSQSQAILQDALRTHANRPLLLLFTMRQPEPTDADRFARLVSVSTTHELLPLSDESCDRLVHRFCAKHEESLDGTTRDRIIQLSGGNPFFLVELLKHRSELVSNDLPITVQALLEDRLNRLSAAALMLLRAAAILGLSSNVDRLQRMVERKTTDVLAALSELHAAGMLASHGTAVVCRHDTIRDAVLQRTPHAARLLLHRRAARALSRDALAEAGVALLWQCVHHWRSAGAPQIGHRLTLVLSRRLLELGLANDALPVLEEVEESSPELRIKLRALSAQAYAARLSRDGDHLKRVLERRRTLCASTGRLPRVHSRLELLEHEGQFYGSDTFISLPDSISTCITSETASLAHRLAAARLAIVHVDNYGDESSARMIYNAVRELRPGSVNERIDWHTINAVFHAAFGDVENTSASLVGLVDAARQLRHPVLRGVALRRAAWGLSRFGPRQLAREVLMESIGVFERLGLPHQLTFSLEQQALLDLEDGLHSQVQQRLDRVHEVRERSSWFYCQVVEFEIRVRLAFELQSLAPLADFQFDRTALAPFTRVPRSRLNVAALELAEALLVGDDAAISDRFARVEEQYPTFKNRCDQDFVVATAVTALRRMDRVAESRELIDDYFRNSRREQENVLPSLVRLAHKLEIAIPEASTSGA
jgi:DNA-binding SARP family transcriptional activator